MVKVIYFKIYYKLLEASSVKKVSVSKASLKWQEASRGSREDQDKSDFTLFKH
uniref:Uncharacterized protein n=1 Tax=Solanum tuberosum TaxID=4113 RepID=M1ABH4_SOLTU